MNFTGRIPDYHAQIISERDYIASMWGLESPLSELYIQSGDTGLAPTECSELEKSFLSLMNFSHNLAIYFSDHGVKTWAGKSRDFLVRTTLEDYTKEVSRFNFEIAKIH